MFKLQADGATIVLRQIINYQPQSVDIKKLEGLRRSDPKDLVGFININMVFKIFTKF